MKQQLLKKTIRLVSCVALSLIGFSLHAQTVIQDFGTTAGTQSSQTASTTFLPNPTSGTTYARGGATAPNAPVTLSVTGNPLGTTGAFADVTCSSSASVTKMTPSNGYTGNPEFYTSFKILFGDSAAGTTASSGIWTYYQGAGSMFANNSDFTGSQVFTGLRFTYSSGSVAVSSRQGGSWSTSGFSPSSFNQGTVYRVEIVGNNTASAINYNYAGVARSVAPQTYDLYMNGTMVGDDIAEAQLASGANVNGTTFIGISSTGNAAHIFVDDFKVYNAVPSNIATPAIIPGTLVVSNATTSSLDVSFDAGTTNGNGSTVEYAIQEMTTGDYVQANGSLAASPAWQTASGWGTVTVGSLLANTTYTFKVKARNDVGAQTVFGPTASGTTLSIASPFVQITSAPADFGTICPNTAATGSFAFDADNLDGSDLVVNALNGFSYSLTQNGTYTSTLNIPGTSFSGQVVWVRFVPTADGVYDGNITISGGGITPVDVAAAGSAVTTSASATTGSAGSVTASGATLSGSLTEGCTALSVYGFEYSLTSGFADGSGTVAPASNLSGGGFSASVSGLSANTTYYFKSFVQDGSGTFYGNQQQFATANLSAPVLDAPTAVGQAQFTLNWEPVDGATGYLLDVSTSPDFVLTTPTDDLIISEYMEGSGNNKYLEVYNGTGSDVDLSGYELQLFANGGTTPSVYAMSGILANGAVVVYKNASATVYTGTATASSAVNYNGDDAIAIYKVATSSFVDIFGEIGNDPGSAWTEGSNTTVNKTLVRNPSVTHGVTTNPAGLGFQTLATEWTQYDQDDVSHLGAHEVDSTPLFLAGYEALPVAGTSQVVSSGEIMPETTYYYRVRATSSNSTSANSPSSVTTAAAPASFGSISQVAGVVCDGGTATFNVEGLLPNATTNLTYNIGGGAPQTVAVMANASMHGTFDIVLSSADNGMTLTVISVDRADAPGSPVSVTENNTVLLEVSELATYYADTDNDGFGDPNNSVVSCGAFFGYVADNTDCNDSDDTLHQSFDFYVDADNDGYGTGGAVSVCAASSSAAPAGYSVFDTDCDDTRATVHPGAVEIGYNLIDDDCDGLIDEGFPPKQTVLGSSQCNTTLAAIDTPLTAGIVAGAQGYRWRITAMSGSSAGEVQEIDTPLRTLRLIQLAHYAFNTTYKVEVAVYYAGYLQPYQPSGCTVTTPAVATQLGNCNQQLTNMGDGVYAYIIPYATGYKFRITDPLVPTNTQEIERPIRDVRLTMVNAFTVQYGKSYNIEVAVRNTDGSYLPYGPVCTVNTPSFPTVSLSDSQCDDYAVPSASTQIYAGSYPGAIRYVFQITGPGLGSGYTLTKTIRSFTLAEVPGWIATNLYTVKVRMVFNDADPAGPFGKSCTIVAPGLARMANVKGLAFDAVAYPNPFADSFSVKVTTASSQDITVKVYDMTGRLIGQENAGGQQEISLGTNYPSGVYNVVVSQGDDHKTLRVVKR